MEASTSWVDGIWHCKSCYHVLVFVSWYHARNSTNLLVIGNSSNSYRIMLFSQPLFQCSDADYAKLLKLEHKHALKGLALPRASHFGKIAPAGSRRLRSTLAAAPVFSGKLLSQCAKPNCFMCPFIILLRLRVMSPSSVGKRIV